MSLLPSFRDRALAPPREYSPATRRSRVGRQWWHLAKTEGRRAWPGDIPAGRRRRGRFGRRARPTACAVATSGADGRARTRLLYPIFRVGPDRAARNDDASWTAAV